jgi:hypothetical protein
MTPIQYVDEISDELSKQLYELLLTQFSEEFPEPVVEAMICASIGKLCAIFIYNCIKQDEQKDAVKLFSESITLEIIRLNGNKKKEMKDK